MRDHVRLDTLAMASYPSGNGAAFRIGTVKKEKMGCQAFIVHITGGNTLQLES